jgi:palmitoyltransferase
MTDRNGVRAPCTAPELLLKLVLTGTQAHYESRVIDDKRLEHLLQAGKQILYKSHQESDVRQNLGFSPAVWQGLTDVLTKAVPDLEQQSFSWKNPAASNFNNSSSDLIAANYFSLVKDIERLNDLCTIARNLLATTKKAQNLAAEKGFDQQILKLIDVCVRVTARGFDGETNARNEERWQKVVNLYKRLLITCLQFLHNFIMHNEHRKLVLWLDLFGNSQQATSEGNADAPLTRERTPEEPDVQAAREARIMATAEKLPEGDRLTEDGGLGYNIDDVHALFDLMSTEKPPDGQTQEAARLLMDKIRNDMERLSGLDANQLDDNPEALLKVGAALRAQLPEKDFPIRPTEAERTQTPQKKPSVSRTASRNQPKAMTWTELPELGQYGDVAATRSEITENDMTMPRSAQSAAETLQEAKDELMARLQETTPMIGANGEQTYDLNGTQDGILEDEILDSAEDSLDEDEEDDEDYRSPGDQERGLLTDVPLVLGPTEIEALPMIIQAGIVDNFGMKNNIAERHGARNMQAVRCHILLAQEAGRNVLRELLIFIAAWDLPDDEFYFKMMMQIMEAILKNGLMSHAYSDFGQAKDIISPAQAVVIKLLTHIFRAKYSPASIPRSPKATASTTEPAAPPKPRIPAPLSRVDVLTVRYIFTVFRGNIIPETCALIYLQGQIRAGHALAEDFPLNLWDMERVYEGVYQFLEFFAVLTENNDWKAVLVEWELAYDLCTLIKELDVSIPRAPFVAAKTDEKDMGKANPNGTAAQPSSQTTVTTSATPALVAVERPYDPTAADNTTTNTPTTIQQPPTPADTNNTAIPKQHPSPPDTDPPPPLTPTDPADFEWRNLKKLIVLVLSSLVWKCKAAQDQIRLNGGIEPILQCTLYDAHNPYIKEHAVVCLRFLLEGNKENQQVVGGLEGREVVTGNEEGGMLGAAGMRAEIGEGGRVKLVRRRSGGGVGRRGSEVRERFARLDVNARTPEMGKVIGETEAETETDGLDDVWEK